MKFEAFKNYANGVQSIVFSIGLVITGLWVSFQFFYPELIKPIFATSKLQIKISEERARRTDNFFVHDVKVTLLNTGINKIFLPATFLQATAFQIKAPSVFELSDMVADVNIQKALLQASKKILNEKSEEEALTIKAKASNYLLRNRWKKREFDDSTVNSIDVRSIYDLNNDSALIVQISRLFDSAQWLEVNEEISRTVSIITPVHYEILQISLDVVASRSKNNNYLFFSAPKTDGPSTYVMKRKWGSGADAQDFFDAVGKDDFDKMFDNYFVPYPKGFEHFEENREIYIAGEIS